jgi:hypothetical protein
LFIDFVLVLVVMCCVVAFRFPLQWIPELSQHCPGTPYGLVCTSTVLRTPRTGHMTLVQVRRRH